MKWLTYQGLFLYIRWCGILDKLLNGCSKHSREGDMACIERRIMYWPKLASKGLGRIGYRAILILKYVYDEDSVDFIQVECSIISRYLKIVFNFLSNIPEYSLGLLEADISPAILVWILSRIHFPLSRTVDHMIAWLRNHKWAHIISPGNLESMYVNELGHFHWPNAYQLACSQSLLVEWKINLIHSNTGRMED